MGYVPVSALYTTGIKSDQTQLKEHPLMKNIAQTIRNSLFALIAVSLPLTALAEHHEGDEPKVRAVAMALELRQQHSFPAKWLKTGIAISVTSSNFSVGPSPRTSWWKPLQSGARNSG